jgi:hypothetical protein
VAIVDQLAQRSEIARLLAFDLELIPFGLIHRPRVGALAAPRKPKRALQADCNDRFPTTDPPRLPVDARR